MSASAHKLAAMSKSNAAKPKVAALFAGAGGLDLGFSQAGFNVCWANEYDKTIWDTYRTNFPKTHLETRSIVDVLPTDIPDVTGFIGGPPCQSWSEAGTARGIEDHRGQLFFEYLRLIEAKRPTFFLAENVSGILFSRHNGAFERILNGFAKLGYNVSFGLLRASDFEVPQDRDRVIIVGYRVELGKWFEPPTPSDETLTLKHAIWDLRNSALPAINKYSPNPRVRVPNHEYLTGGWSSMFMSRNRVRGWHQPSFTIQAGGRHAPIHPSAPPMVKVGTDEWKFEDGAEEMYRRLTIRECARIQTFPDSHQFVYTNVINGYKMIGNAVPVEFARRLAVTIKSDLVGFARPDRPSRKTGEVQKFGAATALV